MKLAIVTSHQGSCIARYASAMNPNIEATFIQFDADKHANISFCESLIQHDVLFITKSLQPFIQDKNVVYCPDVVYSAFHPDITLVSGARMGGERELISGPMRNYNSFIVVNCYKLGLSIDQTLGFFNHYVFARLGYFDASAGARAALLQEGERVGMPLGAALRRWTRRGCFMLSSDCPEMTVLKDVTRMLLRSADIDVIYENVDRYMADPLLDMPIWPIYPAIAKRLGLLGDYAFKPHQSHPVIGLRNFIADSFMAYEAYERDSIEPLERPHDEFRRRLGFIEAAKTMSGGERRLVMSQIWKDGVAKTALGQLDPVFRAKCEIKRSDALAIVGGEFMYRFARELKQAGLNFCSSVEASVFASGEYEKGGDFEPALTVRQLLQLLQRMEGAFSPEEQDGWPRSDGRVIDPFCLQNEPRTFDDVGALISSREARFAEIRRILSQMNFLIFGFDAAEAWRSRHDGAVFSAMPGVAGGSFNPCRYEFVDFSCEEICADLDELIDHLTALNPTCKIVLMVSPTPLAATFEPQHVLVATTRTKSALRSAVEYAARAYPNVEYFPAYEIIASAHSRGIYYEEDQRTVTRAGLEQVARVFTTNYVVGGNVPYRSASHSSPLVSVIIPSYNHERFVEQALDSVLQSGVPEVELIVGDDASVDETPSLIRHWIDRRRSDFVNVVFVERKKNIGISRSLNELIGLAKGEIVHTLASDDFFLSGGLAAKTRAMVENPGWEYVFCDGRAVGPEGQLFAESLFAASNIDPARLAPSSAPEELLYFWGPPANMHSWRKRAFKSHGGEFEFDSTVFCEDLDGALWAMSRKALGFTTAVCQAYRCRAWPQTSDTDVTRHCRDVAYLYGKYARRFDPRIRDAMRTFSKAYFYSSIKDDDAAGRYWARHLENKAAYAHATNPSTAG